jgi:hypothetical protein
MEELKGGDRGQSHGSFQFTCFIQQELGWDYSSSIKGRLTGTSALHTNNHSLIWGFAGVGGEAQEG